MGVVVGRGEPEVGVNSAVPWSEVEMRKWRRKKKNAKNEQPKHTGTESLRLLKGKANWRGKKKCV